MAMASASQEATQSSAVFFHDKCLNQIILVCLSGGDLKEPPSLGNGGLVCRAINAPNTLLGQYDK